MKIQLVTIGKKDYKNTNKYLRIILKMSIFVVDERDIS